MFCCDLPESVSAIFEARHCPKDVDHRTMIRPSDDQLPKGGFDNEFDAVEVVRVSRQASGAPEHWLFPAATPAMPFPIWLGASARPQSASFLNTRCRLTNSFANRNIVDASRRFPSVQRLPATKCQPELRPFAVSCLFKHRCPRSDAKSAVCSQADQASGVEQSWRNLL